PAAEPGRQRVGDLLHARMQKLRDLDDLAVGGLHLGADARKAARPDLQFGDANRVLIGHAEREFARCLGEKLSRATATLFDLGDWLELGEILPRVVDVLIVGRPLDAGAHIGTRRLSVSVGLGEGAGVGGGTATGIAAPSAAAKPALNAATLSLTPTPPRWIAASNAM